MANTKGGNFIFYCTYLPPNEKHNYRLQELIQKLKLLRYKNNIFIFSIIWRFKYE